MMKQKGTYFIFTPVLCLNERLKKAGAPANVVGKATARRGGGTRRSSARSPAA